MQKLFTLVITLTTLTSAAQLKVDTALTIEHLIDTVLVGKGIRVGNVELNGHKVGVGYFQTDSAVIGMKSGILLSTGSVFEAATGNNTPGATGYLQRFGTTTRKSRRGDRDLNRICKGRTHDVNIIEFDFIPFHNKVAFNYCFASEEYPEYVGSRYNDVFAFIVQGPGVRKTNLAVLPDTKDPITINNVNHKKNKKLYITNDYFVNTGLHKNVAFKPRLSFFRRFWNWISGKNKPGGALFYAREAEKKKLNQVLVNGFQYDGFTQVFAAEFHVTPYEKYHLKIAIGDTGDAAFDSGVFLEEGSLTAVMDTTAKDFAVYQDLSQVLDFDSLLAKSFVVPSVPEEETFEITNVYFDFDEFAIPDTSHQHLDFLAQHLAKNNQIQCALWGYTDNKGSKRYNQNLSEKRAIEVMNYLKSRGIEPQRMTYQGNNFSDPVADNVSETAGHKTVGLR